MSSEPCARKRKEHVQVDAEHDKTPPETGGVLGQVEAAGPQPRCLTMATRHLLIQDLRCVLGAVVTTGINNQHPGGKFVPSEDLTRRLARVMLPKVTEDCFHQ